MHILIAPNAFKNSLSAAEAAQAIQRGLESSGPRRTPSHPPFTTECFPVGDGGDGTGDLLIERLGGQRITAQARDPFGRQISTWWGLAGNSRTAIIEMANASGLRLMDSNELDPLKASSNGTGDLILAALDRQVQRIILGMGGSATVDGGTGILQALGANFLNADGQPLKNLPGSLTDLAVIDMDGIDPRLGKVELMVLRVDGALRRRQSVDRPAGRSCRIRSAKRRIGTRRSAPGCMPATTCAGHPYANGQSVVNSPPRWCCGWRCRRPLWRPRSPAGQRH
jgi:glycerate 2-kinase